jgi:hypothetical protein
VPNLKTGNTLEVLGINVTGATKVGLPYDLSIVSAGKDTVRAVGTNDFPMGVKLQRPVTFTSVTYRGNTADASGSSTFELRKNGVAVAGSSLAVAFGSQVAGGTITGTFAFTTGDIVTVQTTALGTTPGTGLVADLLGVTT